MIIDKEVLLKDTKESNSVGRIFEFFTSNQNELEYGETAKQLYKELGWCQNTYFDVISSFWTTFSFSMHSKFPSCYPIADAGNVKIYKNHNDNYNIDSFPEKYFKESSYERNRVDELCDEYPCIIRLAEICHSVANFMPCPKGFNSPKGILNDVKDYFPLMIDKIQECVDKDIDLEYCNYTNNHIIDKENIKAWHEFFIVNREKYCLKMYYTVKNKTIKGIPFFHGQSLLYPCPKESSEIKECLKNMTECIEDRASEMLKELP